MLRGFSVSFKRYDKEYHYDDTAFALAKLNEYGDEEILHTFHVRQRSWQAFCATIFCCQPCCPPTLEKRTISAKEARNALLRRVWESAK